MIKFQIVEKPNAQLYKTLKKALRTGDLKTLFLMNRGKKVVHKSPGYPGWMNWSHDDGVILCNVISPQKHGEEWKLFSSIIGRLSDKYAHLIHNITIQFPSADKDIKSKKKSRK